MAASIPVPNPKPEEEELESIPRPAGPDESTTIDISNRRWQISLFEKPPQPSDSLYIYRNDFNLVPGAVSRLENLKTLKFFSNDIKILPAEAEGLSRLEKLHVKFSRPLISGFSLGKFESLTELELCKVPPRPSAFSMLGDIGSLKCLTKLSICYFSIRYLPPEIGCLVKLEELDLSFNKLKSLPNDISKLTALKSLRVANNKLVDLPPGLSSLRSLENLDLSNNRLTSLISLKLDSMHALQYLKLQYNKCLHSCQIPPWICCDLQRNEEGNGESISDDEITGSIVEVNASSDGSVHRSHGHHSSYNGSSLSCRCTTRRKRRGWKRRDNMQQWARQERLNYSRRYRVDDRSDITTSEMTEGNDYDNLIVLDEQPELQVDIDEDKPTSSTSEVDRADGGNASLAVAENCIGNAKVSLTTTSCGDETSCLIDSNSSNKDHASDDEKENCGSQVSLSTEIDVPDGNSSSDEAKFMLKSKRHYDRELDNPKPRKFRKPVDEHSLVSCKYSIESFCSIDDHLPDGFYDAGRDRPFMSLQDYEQSLCLDSREVILLDREKDEELDAIATSAQLLLSNFRTSWPSDEDDKDECNNLQRASVLALFVSDCFGGSDRSSSVRRMRKAVFGSESPQPFICTCSTGNIYENSETSKPTYGISNLNFNELCESSLRSIKETRKSNIVPIGTLRFGVCRHRSVLMKYLCDRAKPPIPCELVRGYLDFMPHAWNAVLVKKGNSFVRMIVDACYPTGIREETDVEYYCRYIPLSRLHVPFTTEISPYGCPFPFPSASDATEESMSRSVFTSKLGAHDVAVKFRSLEVCKASQEDLRSFEYTFLGEIRMLYALKKHSCIVEIYGHQLSSKWAPAADGKDNRLLQSMIVMEYIKGGTLKNYLNKLAEQGKKHAPVDITLCVAKDIACALIELHSKHIIHRDLKSENILIDLDSKRKDGTPVVKLSDFDRSVPLNSSMHSCCIQHLGNHPPDVCVGTPRWMAPEVVQAMHQRKPYGLEIDIWSYGCLLHELLTLQIPYKGMSEAQIYHMLQTQQRPLLTPDLLDSLSSLDKENSSSEANIASCSDVGTMKFLVDLFYKCTSGNPGDRPTAREIYDDICAISQQQDVAPTSRSSS